MHTIAHMRLEVAAAFSVQVDPGDCSVSGNVAEPTFTRGLAV